MKRTILALAALALLMPFASSASRVVLAEDGHALATLQISQTASIETQSVAVEVAEILERMTGARFGVTSDRPKGARIVLGRVDEFPELRLAAEMKELGDEAILVRTTGDAVLLIGNSDAGASHAAFSFLQELGCRWYFPTPEWEIIPKSPTLVAQVDRREDPDMLVAGMWYGTTNGYFTENYLLQDWNRHNHVPRGRIATHHSWIGLDPKKDFAEHPEWFALVKGKRKPSKPCYSHPEVIKHAVAYALAQAEGGAKSITVSAPDGLDFCECARCYSVFRGGKPYVEKRALMGKRLDGQVVCATSETLFHMANVVARAVREKYPDVLIGVLAYSGYSHPPSFDFEPNIYVQITTAYRRTPLTLEQQIEAFGRKAKQIGLYEYYHIAVWYKFRPDKGIKIAKLKERMPYYHANNVRGIWAESTNNWAPAGPDFYVAAKMMWNTEADADAIYNDFLTKCFGRASGAMKRYYDRWEAATEMNDASLSDATADLVAAWHATEDTAAKRRIALLYAYVRFLRAGVSYQQAKKAGAENADALGQVYSDLFWRLHRSYMLHDLVSKSVHRPMLAAFTLGEIDAMMGVEAK